MKRLLAAAVTTAAVLVAGCSGGGTPKAVTPETEVNFGDVRMTTDHVKDTVSKEFFIKNEGTGDLKLSDLQVKLLQGC
ncbi:MAG TPA: hypothetical protein VD902_20305 [Symbiobacteriaceae bacterium]|nr:hypothetical protein [Symbiobacteriaceae bacterium]